MFGRIGPLENATRIIPNDAKKLCEIRALTHQASRSDEFAPEIKRGNGLARRQRNDLIGAREEERIHGEQQRIDPVLFQFIEHTVYLGRIFGAQDFDMLTCRHGGRPHQV